MYILTLSEYIVTNIASQGSRRKMKTLSNKLLSLYPTDDIILNRHFEVGAVYEIDHANLPIRSSVQLKSMRVVMVYTDIAFSYLLGF